MQTTTTVNRKARKHFDVPLFLTALLLAGFGVIAITLATYSYSDEALLNDTLLARITSSYYGQRQGLFFLVSPIAVAGMTAINYRYFRKYSGFLYIASILLLLLVLAVGDTSSGVTGWFSFFSGYMLQPSEFAKIAVILHLAKFFSRKEDPITSVREFIIMTVIMAIPVGLIVMQGELGTAMVFIVFYIVMMFMGGVKLRLIAGLIAGGVIVMIPLVLIMRETGSYRYDRIISFIDPSQATADAIYQARNSQIAIGNGGLWGVGWFKDGTYSALNYVPQDHTDFIFSSIGETMGFVGCSGVIVAYMFLVYRMLSLAMHTRDKFARLVIIGMFSMMFFHIAYNIGMTIGVMPVMGIPLPFLSYGGSNLITNMAGIGLVLNITLRRPEPRGELADTGLSLPRRKPRMKRPRARTRAPSA